jgi:hypothetical protein
MPVNRRTALKLAGVAAAGLTVRGSFADPPLPPPPLPLWQPAAGWGALGRPRRILEIFLRGGASFWSSFWRDTTLGGAAGTQDSSFADWPCVTGDPVLCNGTTPAIPTWPAGTATKLGRAAQPITRATLGRRLSTFMRVIRVGHDLLPHEAAIPYAATGSTIGRSEMSGLGALVWLAAEQRPGAEPGLRSLVLRTRGNGNDVLAANALAAFGPHGAEHRPPIIPLGNVDFYDALLRTSHTATDPLKSFYRDRYEGLLQRDGGPTVRSEGWSGYAAALDTMILYAPAIHAMLAPYQTELFDAIGSLSYHLENRTRSAVGAAVDLLATGALEHVAIVDGGVEANYDTHDVEAGLEPEHVQCGNIWNVCDALANHVDAILDEGIAVLIHTEFGRKETSAAGNLGTEHHPYGYVNVVISDLVPSASFVGIAGGADASVAEYLGGDDPLTPTDVHCAMVQLAGVDPYASGLFDADLMRLTSNAAALDLLGIV